MKLENYFRRFGIRNGSGAESSVSAVHLHYRRSADRLRPEHHRRSRKDRRYCKRHENRRPPIRQSPVRRIPLRNLPACQCRSLRPACQILRKTAGCRKEHGSRCRIKCPSDDHGRPRNHDRIPEPEMSQQSVPTLFMVQQGVDSKFMTPLISVLIISVPYPQPSTWLPPWSNESTPVSLNEAAEQKPQAKSAAPRSTPPSLAASQTSSSPSSAC